MKKPLVALSVFVSVYLMIALLLPSSSSYSFQSSSSVPTPAILRLLTDSAQTGRWWPDTSTKGPVWNWEQGAYQVRQTFLTQVNLEGNRNGIRSSIIISAIANGPGSTLLTCTIQTDTLSSLLWRPLQQLSLMRQEREHARLMDTLTRFFSSPDKVYGFRIEHQKVSDGTLLSIKQRFDREPSPEDISGMVDAVRGRIRSKGAKETNLPMLNIYTTEDGGIEGMVAIATDRELQEDEPFSLKRMLPGGNILVAEVRGGPHRIRACQEAVDAYVKDHRMLSPAMPFQRMINDRLAESDTSKWITTINYPVF